MTTDATQASSRIRIDTLARLDSEQRRALLRRAGDVQDERLPAVRAIVKNVRERGDAALREYTARFDGATIEQFEVQPEEYEDALRVVPPGVLDALGVAIDNIQRFHESHLQPQPVVETSPGVQVWREWRPIERVGLYAPGGGAAYPSSVLMNVVPAKVAGCSEIVLCSPPDRAGRVPAVTLAAASLAGVARTFKLGGAQAVAAMAYGAGPVPRVQKVFGAGSPWVTAAKLVVSADVEIDMPAGPSEILIIADETADPAMLAADLLAQSEHGPDSAAVLLTPSVELADRTAEEAALQLALLPLRGRAGEALRSYGRILLTESLEDAAAFANEYAPEHLEIVVEASDELLKLVVNAGSIFLGGYSPVASGDYATGANHVIPTGGRAATRGPLSVEYFGKWIQVQRLSREGLLGLRETVVALAEAEGLAAHARSIDVRFER